MLNSLGIVERNLGEYQRAETLFNASWTIRSNRGLFLDAAQSETNLAAPYRLVGQFSRAEPLYKQSVGICEKFLSPNNPDLAVVLNNFANFYYQTGRYSKAEPLYDRSLKIYETNFGPSHPSVALVLNNLACCMRTKTSGTKPNRSICVASRSMRPRLVQIALNWLRCSTILQ